MDVLMTLMTAVGILTCWWWLAVKVWQIPEKMKDRRRPPLM